MSITNRLWRSTKVAMVLRPVPKMMSPSQWPGTARSVASAGRSVMLTLPRTAPDAISSTVVVRITGVPDIQPMSILQKRDGSITLPASEARLHGSTFQYESGGQLDNIGYWTTPEDWADWEFKLARRLRRRCDGREHAA